MLPAALKNLPRRVTPEALNVNPSLVGLPLAQPQRRAYAMAVDLLLIALLSGVHGLWLVAGLLLVVSQLRGRRAAPPTRRQWLGWIAAGVIGLLALQALQAQWHEWRRPDAVAASASSAQAAAVDDDGEADAAPPGASAPAPGDPQRIVQLERELAEARRPRGLRRHFDEIIDAVGLSFGWGIVYFSLLPAWWGGQTVGKKLFGLRTVELTGKPMTVMLSLKRYGGYAAGMATGGLGFAQALWDANRQGLQDKAAHTVVVDLRARPPHDPHDPAESEGKVRGTGR